MDGDAVSARKVYRIARTFAEDHWARECGAGDEIMHTDRHTVTVILDADGYADMLSDADYYWAMRDELDDAPLYRSARRVRDALIKAGAPDLCACGDAHAPDPDALDVITRAGYVPVRSDAPAIQCATNPLETYSTTDWHSMAQHAARFQLCACGAHVPVTVTQ